jgi:hypothetical protein
MNNKHLQLPNISDPPQIQQPNIFPVEWEVETKELQELYEKAKKSNGTLLILIGVHYKKKTSITSKK